MPTISISDRAKQVFDEYEADKDYDKMRQQILILFDRVQNSVPTFQHLETESIEKHKHSNLDFINGGNYVLDRVNQSLFIHLK